MRSRADPAIVVLEADRAWAARPGRAGLVVTCVDGCAWLTIEGDRQDHVLGPGDARGVAGRRKVVVTTFEGCVLRVAARAPGGAGEGDRPARSMSGAQG